MARPVKMTIASAADPLYGDLSPDGRQDWDNITECGYKPYKTPEGLWFASPADITQAEIGPSESLSVLLSMVMEYQQSPSFKDTVLQADKDGNTYLPGAEEVLREVDIPELRGPALDYHAFKTERIQVLAREVEAKGILDQLMHKHEDELPIDPETKLKYFKVGAPDGVGRAVVIDLVKGADKIKSRVVDEGGRDGEV